MSKRYDGFSRRVSTTETDSGATPVTTRFLWCGQRLCEQRDSSDKVIARYYPQGELRNGRPLFYARDQVGSVVALVDNTGKAIGRLGYDSYGNITSSTGTLPDYRYAGLFHHQASGLYLATYRAYDPKTGRWISSDPIGLRGGLNTYRYVLNDPINFYDPYGLFGVTDLPTIPQPIVDATAGFGDALSFGFTDWLRDQMDTNDAVDKCSGAYSGGKYAGYDWGAATGIGTAGRALQVEVNVLSKGNVFKIISKKLKMGFRVDPAHHGKPWGHTQVEVVIAMADTFSHPDFSSGDIELRFEDDNICIYATDAGLGKIISLCESLREANSNEHIHLEDYAVLTKKSLKGVIARFKKME